MTAMGVPAAGDTHPLHGELPNAPYQKAWVLTGEDEHGPFIGLGGEYEYTVAFNHHYIARPLVKLYAASSIFSIRMDVTNLKKSPMDMMYMAHVNFRPVDNGKLVYTAHCTPDSVRVRRSIPSHIHPGPGFREFVQQLAEHPEQHNVLSPGLAYDPEMVFYIDYLADDDGWAHSMQLHPDNSADVIRHRPDQLDKGVRWISRTPDQDCLGIVLPATAEPEGYTAEKAKGNVKVLDAGATWGCEMWAGYLDPTQAQEEAAAIQRVLDSN
jgi:hypothetical protein